MMEYRPFGQTGLEVSALGFGCWEMGGGYGDVETAEVAKAVNHAVDVGVNCFDTAPAYGRGQSERFLGKALGARRKDVLVVTKCGVGYRDRPKGRDSRPEAIFASIDQSLLDLGTDYVDVLLVHWPDATTPFEETMGALDEVVRQGKARFVGVSNFTKRQMEQCMETRRIDVVQCGYNMFDRRMDKDILPFCLEHGIGVMVYGPLAFGMLTGAFTRETTFKTGEDWRANENMLPALFLRMFGEENFPRNVAAAEDLGPVADERGKKLPHLALRWALSHPAVSVALAGTRNTGEVEDNLGALDWSIGEAEKARIDGVFESHGIDTSPNLWIDSE